MIDFVVKRSYQRFVIFSTKEKKSENVGLKAAIEYIMENSIFFRLTKRLDWTKKPEMNFEPIPAVNETSFATLKLGLFVRQKQTDIAIVFFFFTTPLSLLHCSSPTGDVQNDFFFAVRTLGTLTDFCRGLSRMLGSNAREQKKSP